MSKAGKLVLIGLACIFLASGFSGSISFSKESANSTQTTETEIINRVWRLILGESFKGIKREAGEIKIISDKDIRFLTEDELVRWMVLAQENGEPGAVSDFESIIEGIVELSGKGEILAIAILNDEGYDEKLVHIVAVDQRLMVQGWTTRGSYEPNIAGPDWYIYFYDILSKQIEETKDYLKQGRVKEAIKTLEKAIDHWYATKPILHFYLGDIYLSQESLSEAIHHYRVGLANNGDSNLRVLSNLGCAFMKNGDLKKAAETFERLVKIQPENIEAHFALLNVYKKLGDNTGIYKQKKEINKWRGIMDPFWWLRFWEKPEELELKPKFWFKN